VPFLFKAVSFFEEQRLSGGILVACGDPSSQEGLERLCRYAARLPFSSGLLAGKMTRASTFAPDDHRSFNRKGEAFDRGETFSGIDFETGLAAVEELRPLVPAGSTLAQLALRWILMFEAVSCAIPGAKRPEQVDENLRAADLPPLDETTMAAVRKVYEARIRPLVHHHW
jgi:aryl-alcohol dehydrogenase-like predicted oxidoreductase